MGLLGLLLREGKERAEDYAARKELEEKLGRRVTHEELYSIGSHLDAAEVKTPPKPLTYTPREASTPFGDAKPPIKLKNKLLLFGVPLILLIGLVATFFVMIMPERTYNQLNPFTPQPPADSMPKTVGAFKIEEKPEYYSGEKSYHNGRHWEATYRTDAYRTAYFKIWITSDANEANARFSDRRKTYVNSKAFQIIADDPTRLVVVNNTNGEVFLYYTDGAKMGQINSMKQLDAYEFESAVRGTPPAQVVDIKLNSASTTTSLSSTSLPITIGALLDEFKKDPKIADKKYKDKNITITGTVEVADKDKQGKPMIAFMRPGSTKPTDGMVVCSFDKSKSAVVSVFKKGDQVKLNGKYSFSLMGTNIILENCAKL